MLEAELAEKATTATQALLWLLRGLKFTMIALQLNQADSTQELNVSFSKAYEGTLKTYHNFIVKGIFAVSIFRSSTSLPLCFSAHAYLLYTKRVTVPIRTACKMNW